MKRLLLLPVLLLVANAANAERILLKCTHEHTLEDQTTTTQNNEFSLDTEYRRIAWITAKNIRDDRSRLYETPYAFNARFKSSDSNRLWEIDINRVDGTFKLVHGSKWNGKGPTVEGQCIKVNPPQRLF